MDTITTTREYCMMLSGMMDKNNLGIHGDDRYKSQYHFLLEKAHSYERRSLTNDEREKLLALFSYVGSARVKQCYSNSYNLAMAGAACGMMYAEGQATAIIPVSHAWVEWHGLPIDITWREMSDPGQKRDDPESILKRVEHNLIDSDYFGITIPLRYVTRLAIQKKCMGSVIDDWENRWPLMTKGFDFDVNVLKQLKKRKRKS
jgi:hypothetical protein